MFRVWIGTWLFAHVWTFGWQSHLLLPIIRFCFCIFAIFSSLWKWKLCVSSIHMMRCILARHCLRQLTVSTSNSEPPTRHMPERAQDGRLRRNAFWMAPIGSLHTFLKYAAVVVGPWSLETWSGLLLFSFQQYSRAQLPVYLAYL